MSSSWARMKTLLVINSSGRVTRSITRHLTQRFVQRWSAHFPDAKILHRDVGMQPLPPVNEAWIAAAFADPASRSPELKQALELSDSLIDEIMYADAIVAGVPMYNFGMPGPMKTYLDQIVRVGVTFDFSADESNPYQPLIPTKPLVLITATGASGYEPGGPYAHQNFLEPHLKEVFGFIGLDDVSLIHVGFEEAQNQQFKRSLSAAEDAVDRVAERLAGASQASQRQSVAIPEMEVLS